MDARESGPYYRVFVEGAVQELKCPKMLRRGSGWTYGFLENPDGTIWAAASGVITYDRGRVGSFDLSPAGAGSAAHSRSRSNRLSGAQHLARAAGEETGIHRLRLLFVHDGY